MSWEIVEATSKQQLQDIDLLAQVIWREHYTSIIGAEQVEYMLDKFQSFSAMQQQCADGVFYFQLIVESELAGYFAIYPKGDALFLSKIYLEKGFRGRGLASIMMQFIKDFAQSKALKAIELTVNKYNSNSIAAYASMGFETIDEVVMDIGSGYVMDDYVMRLAL